jgi:O-antigen ligase/Tfp pilus assembly protein PilF
MAEPSSTPGPAPSGLLTKLLWVLFGVCPLIFFTDLTRNPYYTQIALVNVLVPLCWFLLILQAWKQKEFIWVGSALDVPLGLLIAVCALSWGISFYEHPAFLRSIYSEGSKAAIFLWVNTFLVYTLALRVQDRILFKKLLWLTYAVSVIASLYGIGQYFGIEGIWSHTLNPYGSRPVSTFGNPNFMSSYLVLVLVVLFADYTLKITRAPRSLLFVMIMTDFAALLATMTRSSWAGLLVGLGFFLWGTRGLPEVRAKARRLILAVAVGMLLIVVAWPQGQQAGYSPTVLQRITEVRRISEPGYGSTTQRFLIWSAAWGMVRDHPWIGKGWGCFELFYPFYQGPQLLWPYLQGHRTHANNAHNEVLEYWTQVGTIGLGIIVLLWIVFFKMGGSIARRLPPPWSAMVWGLLGGVAGVLVDNLLNVSAHFCIPALLLWWWIGSVFMLEPAALKTRCFAINGPWTKGTCLAGLVVLSCLMLRSGLMWAGEINFFSGFKFSKAGTDLPLAQRYLERAYAFHHLEVNNNYELANVYARLDQKPQALWMYQRALDANAGYDEIYFNRATVYMRMGSTTEAIVSYRRCLDINPLSHDAYNALSTLYLKDLAHYGPEAEKLYLQALQVFPTDKDMWNNFGYLETQLGHWSQAAHAYQKALDLDPTFELARRNLQAISVRLSQDLTARTRNASTAVSPRP